MPAWSRTRPCRTTGKVWTGGEGPSVIFVRAEDGAGSDGDTRIDTGPSRRSPRSREGMRLRPRRRDRPDSWSRSCCRCRWPERTAANRPLAARRSRGGLAGHLRQRGRLLHADGARCRPGRRRHLCRVDEGGSIFAISGVTRPIRRRSAGRRRRPRRAAEVLPGRPDPTELRGRASRTRSRCWSTTGSPASAWRYPAPPAREPCQELARDECRCIRGREPASASAAGVAWVRHLAGPFAFPGPGPAARRRASRPGSR